MVEAVILDIAINKAISNELAFDLSDLRKLREETEKVCDDLKDQRDNLKKGLEELRKDWKTPGGDYFFSKIDDEWESSVTKFISTISKFEEILRDSIEKYKEVEDKAANVEFE